MPQFVILTHDHPFPHWDLMLDTGTALRTWRLLGRPDGGAAIPTEPLADHRREYLTYEGPVSGGRGSVERWDAGEYTLIDESPQRIELELAGERLTGRARLEAAPNAAWVFRPPING